MATGDNKLARALAARRLPPGRLAAWPSDKKRRCHLLFIDQSLALPQTLSGHKVGARGPGALRLPAR